MRPSTVRPEASEAAVPAASAEEPAHAVGRIPALDGLRGLAVILVVLAHANLPFVRYGGIAGVSLFFVLSGFLITSLLLSEQRSHGQVALGAFYARRALRLLPALAVALLGAAVVGITLGVGPGRMAKDVAVCALYLGNLRSRFGLSGGPISHFWTLAMEEQFYLLWPLIVFATRRLSRNVLIGGLLLVGSASVVARLAGPIGTHAGYRVAYYEPHTNAYGLLFGSAMAVWLTTRNRPTTVKPWCWHGALVLFIGIATVPGMKDGLREMDDSSSLIAKIVAAPLTVLPALVLVLAVATGSSVVPRWLSSKGMLFFGSISYGLYLWHEIIDWGLGAKLGSTGGPGLISGVISAVLAVGVAVASRRFVEAPFLRRKARFERARLVTDGPPALSG